MLLKGNSEEGSKKKNANEMPINSSIGIEDEGSGLRNMKEVDQTKE